MATLTRNLKLRLSEDLSNDARYNLERIDQLGSTFNINTNNNTIVRAANDIQFRAEDNSVGGSGTGGTIELGDPSQPLNAAIINGPLKLLSVDSTHYLSLINSGTSNTSLTINTGAANRLLTLGGDVSTSGGNISLVASGNQTVNLPITNAEVANAAAISGSKISPLFGNQLVSTEQGLDIVGGTYTTSIRPATSPATNVTFRLPSNNGSNNYVLTTDGSGNTSWNSLVGTGTVTSVGLSLPASLFSVTGSPVSISGTLTGSLVQQSANLVFAGPSSGPAALPTFRQLSSDEVIAGSTNRFYSSTLFNSDLATKTTTNLAEGTNLYHTVLRAQDAIGALVSDTVTAEMDYVSGTSLSVTVKPSGFINSTSGLADNLGILRIDPTQATVKSGISGADLLLIADSTDSNNLKKVMVSDILTLAGNGYSTTWLSGTTKAVTHNLNTRNVLVEVYDNTTYETVYVDSVIRTDLNTITLTASASPTGAGLTILVKRIA